MLANGQQWQTESAVDAMPNKVVLSLKNCLGCLSFEIDNVHYALQNGWVTLDAPQVRMQFPADIVENKEDLPNEPILNKPFNLPPQSPINRLSFRGGMNVWIKDGSLQFADGGIKHLDGPLQLLLSWGDLTALNMLSGEQHLVMRRK